MGVYDDAAVQKYVSDLGHKIAAISERPDLPWTFRVIDDPTVNAFAVPGGFIYVTRGLMTHLTSEAQLVGVLGHEIGHVTARHSVQDMSKQQLAQIGLGIGMILGGPQVQALGQLAGAGLQVLFLKYSRDHENQADELGVRYMRRTGYDPAEMAAVMTMLDRSSQLSPESGKVPDWLSTHPSSPSRAQHILEVAQASVGESRGNTVSRDAFVKRLDAMVFGNNPREGYFEGTTFLHPDMRFRFEFPQGWQTANGKTAVQAGSPEQDAVMAIELAQGSPSQALQQFASDQNVQVGGQRQTTINGLSATTAEFAVATDQGNLHGLVAFIAHQGSTFRVMGYTPEGRFGSYQNTFSRALSSFAPLTDQRALSVQPERVDVVTPPSAMSLAAFMQKYPSTEKPEIVALINQVEGDARLAAGVPYKRIVDR
jgi:predicted Zn-dependent protease